MVSKIVFLFALVGVNAFFAASEIALISLNDNKIKIMAEQGDKKAIHLMKLLAEPSRFLATIQIGITLAGFLASAFAAETFAGPLVSLLNSYNIPVSDSTLKVIIVILITVILSYFTLVLGELVPKRVAMKKSERIAFFVVTPLTFLSKLTNPFVKLLTASTNFFVRLFGIDPHSIDDDITEEEIRMMIDVGEERGAIDEREKNMINNIFDFNDKSVEEIMTHRMEIVSISCEITIDKLVELINKDQFSRYPVYEDSIDNIIGILYVKDLLTLIAENVDSSFSLDSFLRKPYFVPIQRKINDVFIELQLAKIHIAIVLDEYGGTAGLITIEDLLEEIVGNIYDEYDKDDDIEIKRLDERTFEVSGMVTLAELEEAINIELPKDEYETLNGFLISLFGKIPPTNKVSEVKYNEILFQTKKVTSRRIEKVLITKG